MRKLVTRPDLLDGVYIEQLMDIDDDDTVAAVLGMSRIAEEHNDTTEFTVAQNKTALFSTFFAEHHGSKLKWNQMLLDGMQASNFLFPV